MFCRHGLIVVLMFCPFDPCCLAFCAGPQSSPPARAASDITPPPVCGQEAEAIDLTKLPTNANYHQHEPLLPASLEPLEYARNDIIYVRDLGQGAFGRVFQVSCPSVPLRRSDQGTVTR